MPVRAGDRGDPADYGEAGAVTAETAMVLPMLVALTVGLVWLVSLGVTQIRVVDAARETARSLARDDPPDRALDLGRRVAPPGAAISVEREGERVRVHVAARSRGPGGLFSVLPDVTVDAEAVAATEGAEGAEGGR